MTPFPKLREKTHLAETALYPRASGSKLLVRKNLQGVSVTLKILLQSVHGVKIYFTFKRWQTDRRTDRKMDRLTVRISLLDQGEIFFRFFFQKSNPTKFHFISWRITDGIFRGNNNQSESYFNLNWWHPAAALVRRKNMRPTKRNIPTTLSTFLKYFTSFKLLQVREVPPIMTIQSWKWEIVLGVQFYLQAY